MASNTSNTSNSTNSTNSGNSQTSSSYGNSRGESRPDSIKDALKVLDQALAGQGTDLKDMVGDEYRNIKNAIGAISEDAVQSFTGATGTIRDFSSRAFDRLSDFSSDGFSTAMERGREAAGVVDQRVRSNPWPVIGGVAIGTFALGFLLGKGGSTSGASEREIAEISER